MGRKRKNTSKGLSKYEERVLTWVFTASFILAVLYYIWMWILDHILISLFIGTIIIGGAVILIKKVPSINQLFFRKINIFGKVKDEEIKGLIEVIEGIKVQDVRNEEDFEKQLFQRLDAKNYPVKRQVSVGLGKRIDMVVDGRIGMELKVADQAKNVQDLIGQVTVYKKHLNKIIVGILDCGVVDIQEYIEHIRDVDRENVYVVLIKGDIKRHKKKEEYFMVKKETSRY